MIKAYDEFGQLLAYSDKDGQLIGSRSAQQCMSRYRPRRHRAWGPIRCPGRSRNSRRSDDVPLYYFDFTGATQHLGIGPAADYDSAARPQAIGFFEAAYDIYDVDVTQTNPGASVEHASIGVGNFGTQPTTGKASSDGFGTRSVNGDSWVNTTATAGTSLTRTARTSPFNKNSAPCRPFQTPGSHSIS